MRISPFAAVLGASLVLTVWAQPVAAAPADPSGPEDPRRPGTVRMAERLEKLVRETDPQTDPYSSDRRVEQLASMPEPSDPAARARHLHRLGQELLNAGRSAEAVEVLERVLELFEDESLQPGEENVRTVLRLRALAFLRIGEQENCIESHNADRCLLPIRDGGVHTLQRGSRAAIEAYRELLAGDPDDLTLRWLLNLAYMTVGEYPEKVPEPYLIPPRAFEAEADLGRFPDVAPQAGLDVSGLAGGGIVDDFDGDGLLDVVVSSSKVDDQLRFFANRGDGTFEDRTEKAGLVGIVGGLNVNQADYDNDGRLDVLVLRGGWAGEGGLYPGSLLRNLGGGTFEDVAESAGLLSFHPTQTAAWGDFDNDGWLDLFIGNESVGYGFHPAELYRNDGPGDDGVVTFTNVAAKTGVALISYVKGTAWGDYDNDGWLDLYVSVYRNQNFLYRNVEHPAGGRRLANVGSKAGVGEPVTSFPTWFWDYDNDGWLDLFVSGYGATMEDVAAEYLGREIEGSSKLPRLYRNRGDGTFEDATAAAGLERVLLAMGSNFGDLDNDGYLDFYVGTGDPDFESLMPNRMFWNVGGEGGGRRFREVTESGGFGHLQKGHAISFADLDNDGDQDVHAVFGGAFTGDVFQNALFANPGHGNRWLKLKLVGVTSNRAAIGARIRVTVATPEGRREIHRVVGSGGSFGCNPLRQEIGLGRATAVEEVRILWPGDPEPQVVTGLELDRAYRIREGDAEPELLELRSFDLHALAAQAPPARRHPER